MRPRNASIAALLGYLLVFALASVALNYADAGWANGCFSLAVVALVVATLNATQARGRGRAYWVGFAAAGWGYAVLSFATTSFSSDDGSMSIPPRFVTVTLFERLETMIGPNLKRYRTLLTRMPIGNAIGLLPSPPSSLPANLTVPTTSLAYFSVPPPELRCIHFAQVAHSLGSLLVAMASGWFAAWRWGRREVGSGPAISPSSP